MAAVLFALLISICLLVECTDTERQATGTAVDTNRFGAFAGSASCQTCHSDTYEKHLGTAHHRTSMVATKENIGGSFEDGKNTFAFDAANLIKMEQTDDGFYQTHYQNNAKAGSKKMDIIVGSGRKGQSYLNWTADHLAQLPITYFTAAGQWSNSPGYPPSRVAFNRPVTSRCLECHSTYVEINPVANSQRESFDRNRIILGVECEKCHGPAAEHVRFQSANPQYKEAKFIVNPGKLPRDRIIDFCSLCHGGPLSKTKPSFSFGAGDTLANYFSVPAIPPNGSAIDVHGNQTALLRMSKCFQLSDMTCLSCHNVHQTEKDQLAVFSGRCLSCHSNGHQKECKMKATLGNAITQNCIDCHMPKQPSHAVAVYLQGASSPTPALLRTHYITTYPEETKRYLQSLHQKKQLPRQH